MCLRERDHERESEIPPLGDGHSAMPSPPASSRDFGQACTHVLGVISKLPGLGPELHWPRGSPAP